MASKARKKAKTSKSKPAKRKAVAKRARAKATKRPASRKAKAVKKISRPAARKVSRKAKAPSKARASTRTKGRKEVLGEGNYTASREFRKKEEGFIKRNKAKIPAMGKAAKDALDGPEGDELRAADRETAAHAAPHDDESM